MRSVLAVGLLLAGFALPAPAAAELSTTPDPSWPDTDGSVYALAREGSTVYVGGDFTHIGPRGQAGAERHNLAALDEKGHVLPWNPGTDGPVFSVLAKGGIVYAGGHFDAASGAARASLAALGPDGRATDFDAHLAPDAGALSVGALAASERGVLAGGAFLAPLGQHALVDLNSRGSPSPLDAHLAAVAQPEGDPRPRPPSVADIAPGTDVLYVAGSFGSASGAAHKGLVALNPEWAPIDFAGPGLGYAYVAPSGATEAVASSLSLTHGRLVVGGLFAEIDGERRNSLATFDLASGALLPAGLEPAFKTYHLPDLPRIGALAQADGVLYLGGGFNQVGDIARGNLAALAADGTLLPFAPGDLTPAALLADHDELIVGNSLGAPRDPNGPRGLARFLPALAVAPTPDRTAPVLGGLVVRPGVFRPTGTRRHRGAARGATLAFALSERAAVTITVTRRGRPRPAGSFVLRGRAAGVGTRHLSGRLDGRALAPGRYVLRARATDGAGNRSRTALSRFRIAMP